MLLEQFEIAFMLFTNDDFADSNALAGAIVQTTGSNVGFTSEPEEDVIDNSTSASIENSAWWNWTAPFTGNVTIDTNGSNFDTQLLVLTGSAVDALNLVADDDDGGDGLQSLVNFDVQAGTTYQIAVDGFFGDEGNISLNINLGNSTTNSIFGDSTDNTLPGTNANDSITGRAGNDQINGKRGDDNLFGNGGNDIINGGRGRDVINGGAGADSLDGGRGRDFLFGGSGNDILDGGKGKDILNGGNGSDELSGGKGADTLIGGKGLDVLIGGDGKDVFVLSLGEGVDIIEDYVDGKDSLSLSNGSLSFSDLTIADSAAGAIIRVAGNGRLAILEGVDSSVIDASDFTTI